MAILMQETSFSIFIPSQLLFQRNPVKFLQFHLHFQLSSLSILSFQCASQNLKHKTLSPRLLQDTNIKRHRSGERKRNGQGKEEKNIKEDGEAFFFAQGGGGISGLPERSLGRGKRCAVWEAQESVFTSWFITVEDEKGWKKKFCVGYEREGDGD